MAEMPHPWTPLVAEGRYLDFALAVVARRMAGGPPAPIGATVEAVAGAARREHAALAGRRLPPGPTAEYVVIERLVGAGLVAAPALDLVAPPPGVGPHVVIAPMDPDAPTRVVRGFTTGAEAEEFARTVVRHSIAEHAAPGRPRAEVRSLWAVHGESASVPETGYAARDEFDALCDGA